MMLHAIAGIVCSALLLAPLGLPDPFGLRRLDMRTDLPPPKPFKDDMELPGVAPSLKTLNGMWFGRVLQNEVTMETGHEPRFYASMTLSFFSENKYELRYTAYWGQTRNFTDPRFGGVKVHEEGRFSLAGDIVILEPQTTRHTQRRNGERTQETINNQKHTYIARVDRSYLNIARRCATYQLEPICKEARNVWFSLRRTDEESSREEPDF